MSTASWKYIAPVAFTLLLTACVPPGGTDGTPPAPTGIRAFSGGGSGEVAVTWDPVPGPVGVAHYKIYENRLAGQYWLLGIVTNEALGTIEAGRIGIVDAPDYWPWPQLQPSQRCYAVTTVSTTGREGPMSATVCGSPP
jgi:hypothetical protein